MYGHAFLFHAVTESASLKEYCLSLSTKYASVQMMIAGWWHVLGIVLGLISVSNVANVRSEAANGPLSVSEWSALDAP